MGNDDITRRQFLKNSAILGGAAMLAPSMLWAAEKGAKRPNVIFILSDDQFSETLGCYGNKEAVTPNLDRLAASGVRFTHACVTSPACAPSRVSCLTGRHVGRFVQDIQNPTSRFPVTQPTVASILKAAGYQTGFVGKAHFSVTGRKGKRNLDEKLKDIGFTFVEGAHPYSDKKGVHLERQSKAFDSAIKFVTANKDKPFALFLFTTLTHGPFEAPEKYIQMAKKAPRRKGSGAMAIWLDALVGKLVGKVDTLGIRDRTAIIFAGDNLPSGGRKGKSTRRGNKRTMYDGWVPQIVSWPGHVKKGLVVDQVVQNIDYLPTILDMCGVKPPAAAKPDGASFVPLMTGKEVKWREEVFLQYGPGRAVRTDRWKYIALRPVKGMYSKLEKSLNIYGGERDVLFDLKKDPQEQKNVFKDPANARVVRDMQARLRRHCATYDYKFGEFGGK